MTQLWATGLNWVLSMELWLLAYYEKFHIKENSALDHHHELYHQHRPQYND